MPEKTLAPERVPIPQRRPERPQDSHVSGSNSDALAQLEGGGGTTEQAPVRPEPRPETPEYVDSTPNQKAAMLARLYEDNRDLLDANGVSSNMETRLAAASQNEGGRNEARRLLGNGYVKDAGALQKALGDQSPATMTDEELEAVRARLPEDQQYLLDQAAEGGIDLAGLSSEDETTRDAAREGIVEAGIQHRTSQYAEMTALSQRQAAGETLSREERQRLGSLQGMKGTTTLGMSGKLGDLEGMSTERFAEIYEEGQQRFEPVQYRNLRRSYQQSLARHEQDPDRQLEMRAGIGRFDVTPEMQASLGTDHDLIADMATSYGTSQIMGAYAQAGLLNGVDAEGNEAAISLDEMKASKDRLSPNADDMRHQMAFMRMKGIDLGGSLSAGSMAQRYNGARRGSSDYNHYRRSIEANSERYLAAKRRL